MPFYGFTKKKSSGRDIKLEPIDSNNKNNTDNKDSKDSKDSKGGVEAAPETASAATKSPTREIQEQTRLLDDDVTSDTTGSAIVIGIAGQQQKAHEEGGSNLLTPISNSNSNSAQLSHSSTQLRPPRLFTTISSPAHTPRKKKDEKQSHMEQYLAESVENISLPMSRASSQHELYEGVPKTRKTEAEEKQKQNSEAVCDQSGQDLASGNDRNKKDHDAEQKQRQQPSGKAPSGCDVSLPNSAAHQEHEAQHEKDNIVPLVQKDETPTNDNDHLIVSSGSVSKVRFVLPTFSRLNTKGDSEKKKIRSPPAYHLPVETQEVGGFSLDGVVSLASSVDNRHSSPITNPSGKSSFSFIAGEQPQQEHGRQDKHDLSMESMDALSDNDGCAHSIAARIAFAQKNASRSNFDDKTISPSTGPLSRAQHAVAHSPRTSPRRVKQHQQHEPNRGDSLRRVTSEGAFGGSTTASLRAAIASGEFIEKRTEEAQCLTTAPRESLLQHYYSRLGHHSTSEQSSPHASPSNGSENPMSLAVEEGDGKLNANQEGDENEALKEVTLSAVEEHTLWLILQAAYGHERVHKIRNLLSASHAELHTALQHKERQMLQQGAQKGADAFGDDADTESTMSESTATHEGHISRKSSLHSSSTLSKHSRVSTMESGEPFVSELAMQSFQLTSYDEPVCVEVDVEAAVLFVDISGYSKVTKELEHRGAYALFDAVNPYFSKICDVIHKFKGQIVKFAGDAILAVWYLRDVEWSVKMAAHCAMELQVACGAHNVLDTEHVLKLHIGLSCGAISSTVFRSATVRHMQSHFHLVSGEPLREIGEVVDTAKPGEICFTGKAVDHMCSCIKEKLEKPDPIIVSPIQSDGQNGGQQQQQQQLGRIRSSHSLKKEAGEEKEQQEGTALALLRIHEPLETCEECHDYYNNGPPLIHVLRQEHQDNELDFDNRSQNTLSFIPPTVREALSTKRRAGAKGGTGVSHMAEMRLLTVLFIHKTDTSIDIDDWFEEVQRVIDSFRCGILQVIDDDKGVHVVAAVNLFVPDREPAVTGIRLARALSERRAGCTIGVASGVTFMGVVGSDDACRFDITGWACVRACRLMQHALSTNIAVCIGESVVQYSQDASLTVPIGAAQIKGSPHPVNIFGIADVDTSILSCIVSATGLTPMVHRHGDVLRQHLVESNKERQAAVIHGCSGTGKTSLGVRSVYGTGIVPMLHTAVEDSRTLDVLWTIAGWFSFHTDPDISAKAMELKDALERNHNIRSTALCLSLVNLTILKGIKTALVIKQGQRLDVMSLSFIRQSMNPSAPLSAEEQEYFLCSSLSQSVPVPAVDGVAPTAADAKAAGAGGARPLLGNETGAWGTGRWVVLVTVTPQNGKLPWSAIATLLGHDTINVITGPLDDEESKAMIRHRIKWDCETNLERAIATATQRNVGCIDKLIEKIEDMDPAVTYITKQGKICATQSGIRIILSMAWPNISPAFCTKLTQLEHALPARAATVLRVIALLQTPYLPISRNLITAVACAHFITDAKKKVVGKEIELLIDLGLLTIAADPGMEEEGDRTGDFVAFENPATCDVVLATALPHERTMIYNAAIQHFQHSHELDQPEVYFALAHYTFGAGDHDEFLQLMRSGWFLLEQLAKTTVTEFEEEGTGHMLIIDSERTWKARMRVVVDLGNKDIAFSAVIASVGKHRRTMHHMLKECLTDNVPEETVLPQNVVQLRSWRPPMSFGALNMAIRQVSICVCRLTIDAAAGRDTPEQYLVENRNRINLFGVFKEQIDRVVGFECPEKDERELLLSFVEQRGSYEEMVGVAHRFQEYIQQIVLPRHQRLLWHVMDTMYVPYRPSYRPVFLGTERESMKRGLELSLLGWEKNHVQALKEGLMELATQGWIPKNPEQTLEYQRDCYLRNRTQEPACFLSLLYINLSLSSV